jgi:uncharacterized SAM-dependent methyltransferase
VVIFTHRPQAAFLALGIAGYTNIPAVKNKPVMENVNKVFGNKFDELQFGLQGVFGANG